MSSQSIVEAVLKTKKLFALQSQTEKNKLFEKAPEQSFIKISKQRKPKIFPKFCFLCKSPDHFARDCFLKKLSKREFMEEVMVRLDKNAI